MHHHDSDAVDCGDAESVADRLKPEDLSDATGTAAAEAGPEPVLETPTSPEPPQFPGSRTAYSGTLRVFFWLEHFARKLLYRYRSLYREWISFRMLVGILVVVPAIFAIASFWSELTAREDARRVAAWALVAQAPAARGNIGLIDALQLLNAREISLASVNLEAAWLEGASLPNADLRYARFVRAQMQNSDLSGANLTGAVLSYHGGESANLSGARLVGAVLADAELEQVEFSDADISNADLRGARLRGINISGADCRDVKGLTKEILWSTRGWPLARFDSSMTELLGLPKDHNERLRSLDFSGYVLRGGVVRNTDLQGSRLVGSDLRGVNLLSVNLDEADLTDANLEAAQVDATFRNAILRNANLREAVLRKARLEEADLTGAAIAGADLARVNLASTIGLSRAQIMQARNWPFAQYSDEVVSDLGLPPEHNAMVRSNTFRGYDLRGLDMRGMQFGGADLTNADLSGADLRGADLNAKLDGADLRGADLRGATFPNSHRLFDYACGVIRAAKHWESAYRDPHHACGARVPSPPSDPLRAN